MKWVFDTVSLSNFLISDPIFLLEKRYKKRGFITWEVYDELSAGMLEYPKLKQINALLKSRVFNLVTLSIAEHKHFLEMIGHLGKGEASCIAYAKERNAIVVTDDRATRKRCSIMEIPFTGTIGILKSSYLDGHITLPQADDILSEMIEAGFYSPIRSISSIV